MQPRLQIHPLLGLVGVTAIAAALLAATRAPTTPIASSQAGAERVAVPAVTSGGRTIVTDSVAMGNGSVRSWVRLSADGTPASLGITFPESALENLPTDAAGKTCCDGPEFVMPLPGNISSLPFTHVVVNWNPKGHEPVGIYDKPHFDFHFYMISPEVREKITAEGEDLVRCTKPLSVAATPVGYVPAPGGVPKMGAHWLLATTPELHGQPFTKTFIYGAYDGKVAFLEPMITLAYLQSHPDFSEKLPLPQAYPTPGHYPTSYAIRFDSATREYTISLDNLQRRD